MGRICVESTSYARLKGNHMFTMTVEKLKVFLAILLVNRYAGLPRQEIYWERREDSYNLVVPTKRYLHLADNNALNSSDILQNQRPLFKAINEQCILNYQPIQHVSVEESMVPHFGKHGAKQYIHGKSIKFGFKFWAMATPLGYCIQFRPYVGKDSILQEYENIGPGLVALIVANLVSKLPVM